VAASVVGFVTNLDLYKKADIIISSLWSENLKNLSKFKGHYRKCPQIRKRALQNGSVLSVHCNSHFDGAVSTMSKGPDLIVRNWLNNTMITKFLILYPSI